MSLYFDRRFYLNQDLVLLNYLTSLESTNISKNNINKNNVSKYKFHSNSSYSCNYCFENFKAGKTMCINTCFHY
jgi:hypothetical protein